MDPDFRDYVVARSGALLRTAYLLTGDPQEAEDLLQEALFRLSRVWRRVGSSTSVDAYVRRTMVNLRTSKWRRTKFKSVAMAAVPERPSADVPVDELADRDELWLALSALPPRMRAVLVLRFYEDLTETEVAELLECSVGTVKSQEFASAGEAASCSPRKDRVMLTEELGETLRARSADVEAMPIDLLDGVVRRQRSYRRHQVTAVVASVAVLCVAGVATVHAAGGSDRKTAPAVKASGVPCDKPTRKVPHYLRWPCASGSVTAFDRGAFKQIKHGAIIGRKRAPADLQVRVLAFGPLPAGSAGAQVVFAEYWDPKGTSPAEEFVGYFVPAKYHKPARPKLSPDSPVLSTAAEDSRPRAGALMVPEYPPWSGSALSSVAACEKRMSKQPKRSRFVSGCSYILFARSDITTVRLDKGNGNVGPSLPVVNGIAAVGLPQRPKQPTFHRQWRFEGLNARGHAVAGLPYDDFSL